MERDLIKLNVAEMVRFMKCFIGSPHFAATVLLGGACDYLWPMKCESSSFPGWGSKKPCATLWSLSSFFIPDWATTSGSTPASLGLWVTVWSRALLTHSGHMARLRKGLLFCQATENLGMFLMAAESSLPWELQQTQIQGWPVSERMKSFTLNQESFFNNYLFNHQLIL